MRQFRYRSGPKTVETVLDERCGFVIGYGILGKGKVIHLVNDKCGTLCGAEKRTILPLMLNVFGNEERFATCKQCAQYIRNYRRMLAEDAK